MTTVSDTLVDEPSLALARICIELARARLRQREEDAPIHRAAVARCRAEMDAALYRYTNSFGSRR
jgi:hypothetical protein